MERQVLRFFLNSGPVRKLDISVQTRRLLASKTDGNTLLFDNATLNNCILMKCVQHEEEGGENEKPIATLVFIPYDMYRPVDGGESFLFNEDNFWRFFEHKINKYSVNFSCLANDFEKLSVLDSVPTFCPFLVALAFERSGMSVPAIYLDLPPDLKSKLTAHLKSRIRPLIVAAYGGGGGQTEAAVEEVTNRLFSAKHAGEIMPLVQALRLPVESAHELVQSWIGIAYFEHEYSIMQPAMKRFANWLTNYGSPKESLSSDEQAYFVGLKQSIMKNIRNNWNDAVNISAMYRKTYDDLLTRGKVGGFRNFLMDAKSNYWQMAELLGRIEQSTIAWRQAAKNYPQSKMPYAYLLEFFSVLRYLNNVNVQDLKGQSKTGVMTW